MTHSKQTYKDFKISLDVYFREKKCFWQLRITKAAEELRSERGKNVKIKEGGHMT